MTAKSPEQVVAEALEAALRATDGYYDGEVIPQAVVAALREAGMLVEGELQYGRRNRETGATHVLDGSPRDDWWHEKPRPIRACPTLGRHLDRGH